MSDAIAPTTHETKATTRNKPSAAGNSETRLEAVPQLQPPASLPLAGATLLARIRGDRGDGSRSCHRAVARAAAHSARRPLVQLHPGDFPVPGTSKRSRLLPLRSPLVLDDSLSTDTHVALGSNTGSELSLREGAAPHPYCACSKAEVCHLVVARRGLAAPALSMAVNHGVSITGPTELVAEDPRRSRGLGRRGRRIRNGPPKATTLRAGAGDHQKIRPTKMRDPLMGINCMEANSHDALASRPTAVLMRAG